MKREKKPSSTEILPPRGVPAPVNSETSRLWHRLPTIVKIVLTVPLVMALLGAEIVLCLAPQLDVILTAASVCAVWAWLGNRSSTAV